MLSKVEIANLPILDLGGNAISSFTEGSKEANLVSAYWNAVRDEMLGKFNWSFAKKWLSLAEDTGYDIMRDDYEYAYTLPSDYIRDVLSGTREINYVRKGTNILSNETPFNLEYIWRIEDTTLWPLYFDEVVAARLRSRLAIPLSKKGTKTTDWYQMYLLELDQAKTQDAMQGKPTTEEINGHTADTDTILQSRK